MKSLTRISKTILCSIGILVASIVIGTLLMILVYALPVDKMQEHVNETIATQVEEGDYYQWIPQDITSKSDNFTDALMINNAIYDGNESVLYKALLNPRWYYQDCAKQTKTLKKIVEDEPEAMPVTYGRYWHGYLVALKPLLLLFNYYTIRWIYAVISCILIALVLVGFYRRFGDVKYAVAFIASYAFLNPVVLRASMQFNAVFFVILLEYVIALYFGDALEKKKRFGYLFLFSGILVAFIDVLTYPVAALGMLLVLWFLIFAQDSFLQNIIGLIKSGVFWIVGYAGMWAGKWLVASCLTDENIITNAIGAAKVRTGTDIG